MIDVLCILFGVLCGLVAYTALDYALPRDISAKRVGGLTFVRFGRLSLSYSIRKA